ncbi:hypothetical protein ACWDCB_13490 [Streptomyces sp. NPDC001178]
MATTRPPRISTQDEDVVARTIESAATARVALAGTNWIPGEGL